MLNSKSSLRKTASVVRGSDVVATKKDWTGNNKSAFVCIGASNHTNGERETLDYYATEPKALELLLDLERFDKSIWECACGELHLSNVLERRGYNVRSSDIVDRLHNGKIETLDFLQYDGKWNGDIITNPPYSIATEFAQKALDVIQDGHRVAMFLKLTFLETYKRRVLFDKYPPKVIYVSTHRLQCAKNGEFKKYKSGTGTAIAYGWYIWEKGNTEPPVVRWFN